MPDMLAKPYKLALETQGTPEGVKIRIAPAVRQNGCDYAITGRAGPVDFFRKTANVIPIENSESGIYKGLLKEGIDDRDVD